MKSEYKHKLKAFTLVECLIVVVILMVSVVGVLSFRYYAILDAERAETQLLAARAATVISEAWRASKGIEDFDPQVQEFDGDFDIEYDATYMDKGTFSSGYLSIGQYNVTVEGRQFQARLSYRDMAGVSNVRVLHVVLTWQDSKQLDQQFHLSTLSQTS